MSAGIELFSDLKTPEAIFGHSANIYCSLANELLTIIENVHYKFTDDSELSQKEKRELNRIYWQEILMHAHLASSASLIRTSKWIDATAREYSSKNLVGWSACCRGLIEAIGDTIHALEYIPLLLAENHKIITKCLQGDEMPLGRCGPIEELLIHFSHARKVDRSEQGIPDSHRKKSTREYIEKIDKLKVPNIVSLYEDLCEHMHPSAASVQSMFVSFDKGVTGKIDPTYDRRIIDKLLERFSSTFHELLMVGYNPIFLTLRTLDYFNQFPTAKPLHQISLHHIPLWKKIEAALADS